jgi:hypothetical protein
VLKLQTLREEFSRRILASINQLNALRSDWDNIAIMGPKVVHLIRRIKEIEKAIDNFDQEIWEYERKTDTRA